MLISNFLNPPLTREHDQLQNSDQFIFEQRQMMIMESDMKDLKFITV